MAQGKDEPCYICLECDSTFQPVSKDSNQKIVDLLADNDLLNLWLRCRRLTRLVALNAPKVILANELACATRKGISFGLFDDLKRMLFSDNYPTFSDQQTVDIITTAELSLKKRKKK